jgi:hypothetical protein
MELQQHQIIAYYTFLLVGYPLTHTRRGWIETECPFDHDTFQSLRIDPATGNWECRRCGGGGIHEFQMRAYSANWDEADHEIKEIISEQRKN